MKKSFFTILSLSLLASCTSELADTVNNATETGNIDKVTLQSHPFEFEDESRTLLTAGENSISFAWANTDAIGVFPVAPTTNNQAKQEITVPAECENDAHYASFDGAGWGLKEGNTYAAYTPYNGNLAANVRYDAVPISLTVKMEPSQL